MKKVIFTYNDIQVIDKERNALDPLGDPEAGSRPGYYGLRSCQSQCYRCDRGYA